MFALHHVVLFEAPTFRKLMVIDGIPILKPPFTGFVIVDSTLNQEAAEEAVRIWTESGEGIDWFQEIWVEANDPARKGAKFCIMNALVHKQERLLERAALLQRLTIEQHFSQVKLGRTLAKP